MTLRLYDTLTKQKQTLEDLPGFDRNNVRMYVCGPTVYDYAHIGNARPVIVFDVLFRLLRHLYGAEHVTYVRNITDIDDKINARAAEVAAAKGVSVEAARAEITAATAKQYDDDVAALGCLPPTHAPRATEYVPQMIAMIEALVASGHAYAADGHVLFNVSSKPDYGKLARRSLDEMIAGARVEVAPYKKNPMDFVLWKPSDAQTPGWESPWGRGRPGWHVECSAMGEALLGKTFDIHGGGIDLMFPHHENEIAQSESAHHGHPLARVWMHNGFLQVEGEKMSKSLGNFVTIRELLRGVNGTVLRFNMMKTHYRQPIDWTGLRVVESRHELLKWSEFLVNYPEPNSFIEIDDGVIEALNDDLNTPAAITRIRELFDLAEADPWKAAHKFEASLRFLGANNIRQYGHFLGGTAGYGETETLQRLVIAARTAAANNLPEADMLFQEIRNLGRKYEITEYGDVRITSGGTFSEASISNAIDARNAARKAKDFKKADEIRDELLAKGIVLKDGPNGTTWEVKR